MVSEKEILNVGNIKESSDSRSVISDYKHDGASDNWDGLPESCQNMGKKAQVQFLKTKVIMLQNDVETLKTKYRSKVYFYFSTTYSIECVLANRRNQNCAKLLFYC